MLLAGMRCLLCLYFLLPAKPAFSDQTAEKSSPELLFDARSVSLDRENEIETLRGDVVAISAALIIAADTIAVNRASKHLHAEGHVLVLSSSQVFSADTLELDLDNLSFEMTDAVASANDPKSANTVQQKILGFSAAEIQFEADRQKRLDDVAAKKNTYTEAYRKLGDAPERKESLVRQYVSALEQEAMIRAQQNRELARLPSELRASYQRRRAFWEKSRTSLGSTSAQPTLSYFVMSGETIRKIDATHFMLNRAYFTPCRCEQNESPAWGFRAADIHAEEGGYADLKSAILEIKGIPIVYLPLLKLPLKGTRQPGFLMPSITYTSDSGNTFSQAVYFAPDAKKDTTATFDMIEKRGLRFGIEQRFKLDSRSGWTIGAEAIRDQKWISQHYFRRQLVADYLKGYTNTRDSDFQSDQNPIPDYESRQWWDKNFASCQDDPSGQCVEEKVKKHLLTPENVWRGKMQWRGVDFFTDRTSVQSMGSLTSDHRYTEDLYTPQMSDIGVLGVNASLFSSATTRVHGDFADYYIGAGSAVSDHHLGLSHFSGYQLPIFYKAESRFVQLTPEKAALPIYGVTSIEQKKIQKFVPSLSEASYDNQTIALDFGNGSWSRYFAGIVAPMTSHNIVQSDFFANWQKRFITFDSIAYRRDSERYYFGVPKALDQHINTIDSPRYGMHFRLPIDGVMTLQDDANSNSPWLQSEAKKSIEHWMNFDLTFSLRPYVHRDGPYAQVPTKLLYSTADSTWQPANPDLYLTYFESDRPTPDPKETVQLENMDAHQIINFSMAHDWFYTEKSWVKKAGSTDPDYDPERASLYERAKYELDQSLDLPLKNDDIDRREWFDRNFVITNKLRTSPLHFDSAVGYDFVKAKQRAEDIEKQNALPDQQRGKIILAEPWSSVVSNLKMTKSGSNLSVNSSYHIYSHTLTRVNLVFNPPPIFGISSGASYLVETDLSIDSNNFVSHVTRTRTIGLGAPLGSELTLTSVYGIRSFDSQKKPKEEMAGATLAYMPNSLCWGLKFGWQKAFADPWSGTYLMSVVVTFYNQTKEFGNFAARFNQPP